MTDRFYWSTFDPINLSEAFFSVGIIFAFTRILFFFSVFETIGPLQICLGKMIFVINKIKNILILVDIV